MMEATQSNIYEISTNGQPCVALYRVPSIELADNGKKGAEHHAIRMHVSTDGDIWLIFTTTDGDMAIGWVDHRIIEFQTCTADWFDSFNGIGDYKVWLNRIMKESIGAT